MKCPVPYLLLLLVSVLFNHYAVHGEEECTHGKINCYDCNSDDEPHCKDPFNYTSFYDELPFIEECDGCCVKIVQNQNTPYELIRRTCTKKLQISLFMVDNVCMKESKGTGHMCFCEEDYCNGNPRWPPRTLTWLAVTCSVLITWWN